MQHTGRPQNLKAFLQDPSVYDLMTLLYKTAWTTPSPAAAVGSTPFAPGDFLAFRFGVWGLLKGAHLKKFLGLTLASKD